MLLMWLSDTQRGQIMMMQLAAGGANIACLAGSFGCLLLNYSLHDNMLPRESTSTILVFDQQR